MRLIICRRRKFPSRIVNVAVGLFKDTTLVSIISDVRSGWYDPWTDVSTDWNGGLLWELWGFAALLFFIVCYGIQNIHNGWNVNSRPTTMKGCTHGEQAKALKVLTRY
jgi:ABC-type amino acid transport system permease subunit